MTNCDNPLSLFANDNTYTGMYIFHIAVLIQIVIETVQLTLPLEEGPYWL